MPVVAYNIDSTLEKVSLRHQNYSFRGVAHDSRQINVVFYLFRKGDIVFLVLIV